MSEDRILCSALCGAEAKPEYKVGDEPYCSDYCAAVTGAEPWEPGDILEAWQGLQRNLADNGGKASLAFYLEYWTAVSALAEACELAVPSAEALESALVDSLSKGSLKRYLKRSRSEVGAMFSNWRNWHNSGGSLYGPITWSMFRRAESELWENLTAADVAFRKRIGAGGSRALSAWDRALGGTI